MILLIFFWFLYDIKQEDSMLPCVCSVIDHRRHQNVVRTSVAHSPTDSRATFLFLTHFDVICDLFLNRSMATWNIAYTLVKLDDTRVYSFLVTLFVYIL